MSATARAPGRVLHCWAPPCAAERLGLSGGCCAASARSLPPCPGPACRLAVVLQPPGRGGRDRHQAHPCLCILWVLLAHAAHRRGHNQSFGLPRQACSTFSYGLLRFSSGARARAGSSCWTCCSATRTGCPARRWAGAATRKTRCTRRPAAPPAAWSPSTALCSVDLQAGPCAAWRARVHGRRVSLAALPVIETQAEDLSACILT